MYFIFSEYLSHPTLMVTAYHTTLCFCLIVSTLVSNEYFRTKLLYIVQLSEFLSDSATFHSALYLRSLWKFPSCYTVARV